jgi:hypothetical protein
MAQEGGAAAVYDFVARTIRTAPVPQLSFRLKPHPPERAVQHALANELDKNVLFMKMLEAAGIACRFALIRDRYQGPLAERVPSLVAFNRSAVYLVEEQLYVTTASDLLPCRTLPGPMQDAPALLIQEAGTQLAKTPRARAEDEFHTTRFEATLDRDGSLTLEAAYSGQGNPAMWMRQLKDLDAQELRNELGQAAALLHPAAVLKEYSATHLADLSTPVAITLSCEIPGYAVKAGEDLMLFTLPGLAYDARDVGRPRRTHGLEWDYAERETTHGYIRLPDGFTVYALPEPAALDSPTASYKARPAFRNAAVTFDDAYELKVLSAPRDAYGEYKACRELRARLPLQRIVLKRTAP